MQEIPVKVINVDEIPKEEKVEGGKQVMDLEYIHSLNIENRK